MEDLRVKLALLINIDGHEPYDVIKTVTIPAVHLAQVAAGNTVKVMADPNEPQNPDKVALLLDGKSSF